MSIAEMLRAEFEQEARTTRKFLERIPDAQLLWKPHEKSMTAGQLALHIATFPPNVLKMALEDEVPLPDFGRPNPQPESTQQVLDTLAASIATVLEMLPTISDERMAGIWRMTKGGQEVLAMPRMAVLRSILLNHGYHHRGQLGVYLRMIGVSVPSSYGPSGDEAPDFVK